MQRVLVYTKLISVEIQECGDKLTSSSGVIESPDEDNDGLYDHNLNCSWTVTAGEGFVVAFQITQLIIRYSHRCEQDRLEVGIYQLTLTLTAFRSTLT